MWIVEKKIISQKNDSSLCWSISIVLISKINFQIDYIFLNE